MISPFARWIVSIDNNNTQFVRYLRAESEDQKTDLFRATAGSEKSDGTKIEAEEAEQFNKSLPDFFSEAEENKNH